MSRISTLQLNSVALNSALNVQSQYAQANTQEATGLVASDFSTLGGGATGEMLNLQDGISEAQTWASNATTVGSRTQAMYTAIGNMTSTLTTLQTKISAAISSSDNSTLGTAVQALQKTLVSQMNAEVAGSYLFSGSSTQVAPVDLTSYPSSPFSVSGADTSYYKGDSNIQSVRVSSQQTVNYGVDANNSGFEEALRSTEAITQACSTTSVLCSVTATDPDAATSVAGSSFAINGGATVSVNSGDSLNTIAASINGAAGTTGVVASVVASGSGYALQISTGSSSDLTVDVSGGTPSTDLGLSTTTHAQALQATLQSALTVTNSAIKDLSNLQESVSATSSQLTNAAQQQTTYVTYLESSLSSVKDVDTAQAAAKVSQYQTQLQASYLAVSEISKINLAQYL